MMLEPFPRYVNYAEPKRRFTWMNDYDLNEKIVIFGDSFASSDGDFNFKENEIEHNNKSWYGVLHHRTQKQIWNHGNGGTSLQYSKQQLFSYLNSKYYKEDDYIIFVTTSYTRVPVFPIGDPKYKPNFQAQILTFLTDDKEAMTKQKEGALADGNMDSYHLFRRYKKELEWISSTLSKEDFMNELRMLQVFLNSLPNKTLLLPAFNYPEIDRFLDIKEFCLVDVSEREPLNESLYLNKEHPRIMGVDPRKQHMSDRNNEVLGIMIDNYFKSEDVNVFSLEEFDFE